MKNNRKISWGLVVIILFGLIPLFWFKNNLLIVGGDEYWLLNPAVFADFFKYAWNVKLYNGGNLSLSTSRLLPIVYFWTFFKSFGLSLVVIERLWIILLFLLPGLSMYYLMSLIFNKKWVKLISAILYMFNLYIIQVGPFQSNIKPVLIALPLMLAFWIKGLNNKGSFLKYSVLIGLCSLIYAESNVNPPAVAVIPIVLLLYLILHITNRKKAILCSLRFTLATVGFYLLLNLWWLSTFLPGVFQKSSFIYKAHTFTALNTGGILEFFRLLGSWAWKTGHYKMSYFSYAHFYNEPFLLILSYSLPLLVFLAIILKPKNKNVLFFSLLAMVGLFLAKGTGAPFGFLYKWTWKNIPGFWIFREPFAKFTPLVLLSFSVLLGFSVNSLYQKAKNWQGLRKGHYNLFFPSLIPVITIIIILIVSYPLLTGEVIWDYWNGSMRTNYVKVPDYWHQMREWLDQNDKEGRVFQTPKGGYNIPYNWKQGFTAADAPAIVLLSNPILRFASFPISYADRISNIIYEFFNPNQSQRFISILRLLNTKYILQQNDLDWKFAQKDTYSPEQMRKILISQPGISFKKSFGKLDLYKIGDEYFLPHIYPSTIPTVVGGDIEALVPLTYASYLNGKPALFFTEQQEGRVLERLLPKSRAFVFSNSNPLDTALQILVPDYGVKFSDIKKPAIFEAKKEEIYQIWKREDGLQASGLRPQALRVRIVGKEVIQDTRYRMENRGIKWKYMGSVELKRGKHRIKVKEALQELVIVPEEKIIETEEKIWTYLKKAEGPPTYFFSKKLSGEIDSWEERSLKESFYIPSPEKYSLRAKVSPQYVEALDYGLKERIEKEWSFVPKNIKYFASDKKNILTANIYFDGNAKEKEFLYLKREIKPVNLEKYSNFEIDYYLANPEVQKIEVILGVDLNDDGGVDTRISEELPADWEKEFSSYSFNLYEKIRDSLGQNLPTDASFHLVKVYLKISKKEGLDCSNPPNKGWYKTSFKDFGLYGLSEDKCVKSRDYVFDERLGLTKELKRKKMRVIRSRSFENLDLKKYPYINLIHQNEDPKSLLVNAILYLDFGERELTRIKEGREFSRIKEVDGEADGRIVRKGITPENHSFNALELAKSEFWDKKHYYLTKLIVKTFKNPEIEERELSRIATAKTQKETERRKEKQGRRSIFLQHLQIYDEKILPHEKACLISPVLEIDQKKLSLTKSGSWYTASPVYLEEGYHNLEALFPGLETSLDFIAIEPASSIQHPAAKGEPRQRRGSRITPEIIFQKINPTKYRVKVKNAREPFWLVFSESFHPQWRAYVRPQVIRSSGHPVISKKEGMDEIVAEYPRLGVKEARHLQKFTPSDIRYLFRKADVKEHYLVNGYANGWWVPIGQFKMKNEKLKIKNIGNKPEEFEIILYFWPQSLFYLGLFISGTTFVGCVGYLVGTGVKKRNRRV